MTEEEKDDMIRNTAEHIVPKIIEGLKVLHPTMDSDQVETTFRDIMATDPQRAMALCVWALAECVKDKERSLT